MYIGAITFGDKRLSMVLMVELSILQRSLLVINSTSIPLIGKYIVAIFSIDCILNYL